MENLYAILGLEDKAYEATEAEIGKAYKKSALKFHPDKLGDKITEKDKEIWLKIQNAYETLTDPRKRKAYDSSMPFDDRIPKETDVETDEDFYDVFAKVFNRNARFSVKTPVPKLGDKSTPIEEVFKFYKFWDEFKTWREFSQYDEYDPEEAADRFERRWMENQNKKLREKHVKAERRRLLDLSELAYKLDPRVKEY
jgi:DnaJ family protein C protein 2